MCPRAAGKLVLRELAHALLTRARFSDGSNGEEVGGGGWGVNRWTRARIWQLLHLFGGRIASDYVGGSGVRAVRTPA